MPLALARQRLLTSAFDFYRLKEPERGPAGGFQYLRRQNAKGEEIGGIAPHVTLESIANDEPAKEEVLFDRPEKDPDVTRVSGPFCIEATIPAPADWDGGEGEESGPPAASESDGGHVERMIEVLRRSPVIGLGGGRKVRLTRVRRPARTLALSAEAREEGGEERTVAVVFGPENGAVAQTPVFEAAREARAKGYERLYVVGFAIEPEARMLVEDCEAACGVPATYVSATMDLKMGDLLRNMRSSQIFSVCGLPDARVEKAGEDEYRVTLLGLDVFDPVAMDSDHREGADVPAWLLDTDYDGLCFHVRQAFFPRTSAWSDLERSLRGAFDEGVWERLAGTVSAPFRAGAHARVAVKAIDDRGNELMVVKPLSEAEG